MQVVNGERDKRYYEFVYLESQDKIIIWKGDLEAFKEKLGVKVLNVKKLTITPQKSFEYMVNVDGLLARTKKTAARIRTDFIVIGRVLWRQDDQDADSCGACVPPG